MIPSVTKRYLAILAVCLATGALLAADPRYIPPTKSTAPTKAEVDRKIAESKRKIEQGKREIQASRQQLSQQVLKDLATAHSSGSSESSAPKFDPEGAPPPDECFLVFVDAAKNAGTMDKLIPYLPQREQETLKTREARFDPAQAAKNRDSLRKQNPKLTNDDLAHLSSSPYAFALKWHKDVANSVLRVTDVKVDGAKATVTVSTNNGATINGEYYPYGMADVKMVGEGRTWKVAGFDTSILVYKKAP
jgi:hypothetical protein